MPHSYLCTSLQFYSGAKILNGHTHFFALFLVDHIVTYNIKLCINDYKQIRFSKVTTLKKCEYPLIHKKSVSRKMLLIEIISRRRTCYISHITP